MQFRNGDWRITRITVTVHSIVSPFRRHRAAWPASPGITVLLLSALPPDRSHSQHRDRTQHRSDVFDQISVHTHVRQYHEHHRAATHIHRATPTTTPTPH